LRGSSHGDGKKSCCGAADPEARGCMAVSCVAELVGVDPEFVLFLEKAMRTKTRRIESLLRQAAANGGD